MPHFSNHSNKEFRDVKLCHTLATIQTKNLDDVKQGLDQSDWLFKTISFERLYRGLSPVYPKETHDK